MPPSGPTYPIQLIAVPRNGRVTVAPVVVVSWAVTGSSGEFDTPLPLQGKPSADLVQPALKWALGSVSCQCDTVVLGCTSKPSTTTTFPCASVFCRPVTVIVSVCGPSLRSLIVTMSLCASSVGRAKRSTSLAGPPSTLTRAIPIALPRLPSHLTEVPVQVTEAVVPATPDCTAFPPLQP